jgi:hypothetical protein
MAASEEALGNLHDKVANTLNRLLDGQRVPAITDEEGEIIQEEQVIEPSAAILTASIQFLKNNNVTCAPSDDNALGQLRDKMKARQERRLAKKADRADLNAAEEQAGWLGGQMGHA